MTAIAVTPPPSGVRRPAGFSIARPISCPTPPADLRRRFGGCWIVTMACLQLDVRSTGERVRGTMSQAAPNRRRPSAPLSTAISTRNSCERRSRLTLYGRIGSPRQSARWVCNAVAEWFR